jgi:hypothetical protein
MKKGGFSSAFSMDFTYYHPSDALKHKTPDPRYGDSHGQRAYRRL